jgi:hypothetical protein
MNDIVKPDFVTLEAALGEYKKYGKIEKARCERCKSLIEIVAKGDSALQVKCQCGLYDDTLRGL